MELKDTAYGYKTPTKNKKKLKKNSFYIVDLKLYKNDVDLEDVLIVVKRLSDLRVQCSLNKCAKVTF